MLILQILKKKLYTYTLSNNYLNFTNISRILQLKCFFSLYTPFFWVVFLSFSRHSGIEGSCFQVNYTVFQKFSDGHCCCYFPDRLQPTHDQFNTVFRVSSSSHIVIPSVYLIHSLIVNFHCKMCIIYITSELQECAN